MCSASLRLRAQNAYIRALELFTALLPPTPLLCLKHLLRAQGPRLT